MIDPTDLRKAALIAFVANTTELLSKCFVDVVVGGAFGQGPWVMAFILLPPRLLAIPGLALLFLLSRSGITLAVPARLRRLVVALLGINIAETAFTTWNSLRQIIHPAAAHLDTASALVRFLTAPISDALSGAIGLIAALAWILFLFALSRQQVSSTVGDERQISRVRRLAVIAICSRVFGLVMMFLSSLLTYLMFRRGITHRNFLNPLSIGRSAALGLQALIAPWVIYRSAASPASTSP